MPVRTSAGSVPAGFGKLLAGLNASRGKQAAGGNVSAAASAPVASKPVAALSADGSEADQQEPALLPANAPAVAEMNDDQTAADASGAAKPARAKPATEAPAATSPPGARVSSVAAAQSAPLVAGDAGKPAADAVQAKASVESVLPTLKAAAAPAVGDLQLPPVAACASHPALQPIASEPGAREPTASQSVQAATPPTAAEPGGVSTAKHGTPRTEPAAGLVIPTGDATASLAAGNLSSSSATAAPASHAAANVVSSPSLTVAVPLTDVMGAALAVAPAVAPSTAPSTAHMVPDAAAQPAGVAAQIGTAMIKFAAASGSSGVTVQLSPEELGKVRISLSRDASGSTVVSISADRSETLSLMMRDQSSLHQSLDQAGVPPEGRSVNFSLSSPPQGSGSGASSTGSDGSGSRSGSQPQPARAFPAGWDSDDGLETILPASTMSQLRLVNITA
jgi:flagellar hook-length control protein FliK